MSLICVRQITCPSVTIHKQELETIREYIKRSLEEFHIAGTALAVIKDDDVIFQDGFGVRDIEQGLPVTQDTLFAIGSSTKAFTTMAIGMLVDDGKLNWDEPVVSYLPEFKLHDKYASENATLRDLATHRVGLPRHDLVWYKARLSGEEIINRLSHLAFSKPFRTTFQYQNMMYLTLGYIVEKITGQSWETFVKERILEPLGMKRTNFSVDESQRDHDFSKPYKVVNQEIEETAFANIDTIGPAGSMNSSVTEMAQWVRLHLGKGTFRSSSLISENNITQMHNPQISIGPSQDERILFPSYALGWFTEVYRGHHIVHHGGNIDGFTSIVAMVPKENIGIVVLTNQENSVLPKAAAYTIFDKLLGLPTVNWNTLMKGELDKLIASMREGAGQSKMDRALNAKPSHDQSAYAGEFKHPAYGTITIAEEDNQLYVHYHAFAEPLQLEHFHYDVFSFTFGESILTQEFKVQFYSDLRGKINRLAIQFEKMLEPIEFVRKAASNPPNLDIWKKYIGEYDLAGQSALVELRGGKALTVTVPGQPMFELVPISHDEFEIKGLSGYGIQFVLDGNSVCSEARFKQPNGTFVLKRSERSGDENN
ncbi:serine hydrolase [Scopulibacillus cellulosilyticus]|uniref:Serine hydrolase n=1 Tax=Scopulibacillus cellulosilyticus TaxID=2665665 RepID=A0ABW2PU25_9BACL